MTPRQIASIVKRVEVMRNKVGKVRDQLDEQISELQGLRDTCDEAWDDLQRARDALSQLA